MKKKKINRDTRFYLDLDLKSKKFLNWDYGQRNDLDQILEEPYHRVFLTKGQYNKLAEAGLEL